MDRDLYNAARSGDVSFLKTKEDTEARNLLTQVTPKGSSILHIAAESDQLEFFQEAARLCLPPSLFKQANSKGDTPLHSAVRAGSTKCVDFIIKHAKDLFSDIEQGHDVEGYKEVLRMKNLDGDNALHLAARAQHIKKADVARRLIEADPELSTVVNSKSQQSACFIALAKWNMDVAKVLLSRRNPSCSLLGKINGKTALHAATLSSQLGPYGDMVRKVVEAAPDMIKQGDDIGWTPLHYAAIHGNYDLVKLFLEKNKSAAYKSDIQDGRSALHIAAFQGRVNTMKALIEACPDCADLVDKRGRNALHAAVLGNQKDAVRFMLRLPGTLFSEADQDGNTPLKLACLREDEDDRITTVFKKEVKPLSGDEESNSFVDKVMKPLSGDEESNSFVDKELHSVRFDMQNRQQETVQPVQNALTKKDTNNNGSSSSTKLDGGAEDDYYYGHLQFSATLIATVTFTAAFTLPGGFIQSGGKDEGMAVLTSKPAFQAFIVFDVLAFFASFSIIVLLLIYKIVPSKFPAAKDTTRRVVGIYLIISYLGMALAFCCGLNVVLEGKTSGFSIVVLLLSLIGTLFALFGNCMAIAIYVKYKIKRVKLVRFLV